jgi:rare lipoprotein A
MHIIYLLFLFMLVTPEYTAEKLQQEPIRQKGIASYYGYKFHGKKTASGELFDMKELTAAHKTLPFNTLVKVTNLKNKKSVIVRVNDRGPYSPKRIIDVSRAAAEEIEMIQAGLIEVELEVLITEPDSTTTLPQSDSIFENQIGF